MHERWSCKFVCQSKYPLSLVWIYEIVIRGLKSYPPTPLHSAGWGLDKLHEAQRQAAKSAGSPNKVS